MSHVRDGELHAYLDGALDRLGIDVADRVRAHLASCGDCQTRVDQERELREEASAVLERALPTEIVAPPFEDLLRRAAVGGGSEAGAASGPTGSQDVEVQVPGKRRNHSAAFPTWKWAWAASLVLALGTGWMMGEGSLDFRNFPQADMRNESQAIAPAEGAGAFASPNSVDEQEFADADASADDIPAPQSSVGLERLSSSLEQAPAAVEPPREEEVGASSLRDQAAAQRRANGPLDAVRQPERDAVPAAPPPPAMRERVAEESVASRADNRVAGLASGDANEFRSTGENPAEDALAKATALDGAPIIMAGVPILAVIPDPTGGLPGILQQLASGDSVLLLWAADAQAATEVEAFGQRQLANATGPAELAPGREPREEVTADAEVRRKVAASVADAMDISESDLVGVDRSLGRTEPWPSVVRIRRGAALLTVYGTGSLEQLRAALEAAGLITSGSSP